MGSGIFPSDVLERIRGIHARSAEFNRMTGTPHQDRLLDLMRRHVEEIEDLALAQDSHYLIETGDLLILCYELLLEGGASIDEVTLKCFERYEKKLGELIDQVRENGEWRIENGKGKK